ncbi:tight adherence protein E [Bisgaardia hudsonensis]|uniref:Tight adherence protein E n=1 Tax=Bisgaardia hudsonensis TaxID=109472 RepID=A0A4R2MYX0_9PAST|nr:TadE family protein [Bisgaardia hudsonensis]QLB12348.1 hypothetical protein A6A11_01315 [Bisgaardia hudsonensis]TCP12396.1 tight adherence protein E [Bisgaardia hudsonensis]
MKKLKHFLTNKRGVSTIEFALTVGIFFFVLFSIFELGRIALLSAYWDLAITESVRLTKNHRAADGNYQKAFENILLAEHKKLASPLVMGLFALENITVKVDLKYAESIEDLISNKFREPKTETDPKTGEAKLVSPTGKDAAIAQYSLNYKYKFLIPLPFIGQTVDSAFKRKILMVQEYERSSFNR